MHESVAEWWNAISLRTKITGVTVLVLTLGLLVAGVGTLAMLRNYARRRGRRPAADRRAGRPATRFLDSDSDLDDARGAVRRGRSRTTSLAVFDADGKLADSELAVPRRPT